FCLPMMSRASSARPASISAATCPETCSGVSGMAVSVEGAACFSRSAKACQPCSGGGTSVNAPVSGLKFRLGKPVPASGDAAKAGPAARQAHTAKTEKKERLTSRGAYGGGFWGYQEASGHALALPAPADPGRLRLAANPKPQGLLTARLVQR